MWSRRDKNIRGGYGKISVEIDENTQERTYFFMRNTPGEIVEIPAGTTIETYGATHYLDYLPVIYIGTNGGYVDSEDLIVQQRAMINHYAENKDRFIIIGIHIGTQEEREELEDAMEKEYGARYINLREYMSTKGIDDANKLLNAGIKASSHDKEMIKEGKTPASLMVKDELHFNACGYELLGNLIYKRMDQLGYFEELQDSIEEIRNDL